MVCELNSRFSKAYARTKSLFREEETYALDYYFHALDSDFG
jgi:hypothetical protein